MRCCAPATGGPGGGSVTPGLPVQGVLAWIVRYRCTSSSSGRAPHADDRRFHGDPVSSRGFLFEAIGSQLRRFRNDPDVSSCSRPDCALHQAPNILASADVVGFGLIGAATGAWSACRSGADDAF